jgi:hypothetical protein
VSRFLLGTLTRWTERPLASSTVKPRWECGERRDELGRSGAGYVRSGAGYVRTAHRGNPHSVEGIQDPSVVESEGALWEAHRPTTRSS